MNLSPNMLAALRYFACAENEQEWSEKKPSITTKKALHTRGLIEQKEQFFSESCSWTYFGISEKGTSYLAEISTKH